MTIYALVIEGGGQLKAQKGLYLSIIILYCVTYLALSYLIYVLSMKEGYGGLGLPLFGGGDDGVIYYQEALNVANDRPALLTSIHALILGWIFKVLQTDEVFVLKVFNYLGSFLLIYVAILILRKNMVFEKYYFRSSIILILLLLLYPSLLINLTMSIYRDVWIYLFFLWSTLLFSNLFIVRRRWPITINIILLLFSIFMLGSYRKYALLSFILASGLYLFFSSRKNDGLRIKKVIIICLIGFSFAYIFLRDTIIPYLNLSLQNVLNYRQFSIDAGGSQMGISLDQPNILYFYFNYFYSFISNTIGPLPWQVNSVATLIVFLTESIVFVVIILFLYKQRKLFSKLDIYLIIQSLIWFMLISISNDNLGTASRLRIVGWLPLIIVFSKYFGRHLFLRNHRKKARGART